MVSKQALSGIRLVECLSDDCDEAVALAIGFAGRVAADLGASVTVVQSGKRQAQAASDTSGFLAAGKSPLIGLRDDEIAELIRDADGVLCDTSTHERLFVPQSRLVWTILSLRGSASDEGPGSEFTIAAESGLLDMVGDPEREPLRLGGHQLCFSAGLAAYAGLSAGLCTRTADRTSETVRVSLADVAVWLNWKSVATAAWSDRVVRRLGSDAEWRIVRCADGWVALVFRDNDWAALCDIVNDERLRDPRFLNRVERKRDAAFISDIVEVAFSKMTRAEVRSVALDRRVPLGAVWSPAELVADPQYEARGFIVPLDATKASGPLRPRLPVLWRNDVAASAGVAA